MKSKYIGSGGFGKVKIKFEPKFNKKVVYKKIGDDFFKLKNSTKLNLTSMINNYSNHENMLKKESIVMALMKVCKLDCYVEILGSLYPQTPKILLTIPSIGYTYVMKLCINNYKFN